MGTYRLLSIIGLASMVYVLIFGCSGGMRLLPFDTTRMIGGERSWERSYEVGVQQEIHVGDPLVRVRDYWLGNVPLKGRRKDLTKIQHFRTLYVAKVERKDGSYEHSRDLQKVPNRE